MCGEPTPQRVRNRPRGVKLVADIEQDALIRTPVGVAAIDGGRDLPRRELHLGGEESDVDAPFVLAFVERAGAIDDDFALPQRQQPAIEQAAGGKPLIHTVVDRQGSE
jgi:hypothetical protein